MLYRLADQKAIERITMMRWQRCQVTDGPFVDR
jgi:hypothetical protein